MEEKASDAKVKFLGGHVEALVKETISCGVSPLFNLLGKRAEENFRK